MSLTYIKQLLQQGNSKCQYSNSATLLCLNQKCQYSNPFICSQSSCKCKSSHKKCTQKRISSFVQMFDEQKQIKNKLNQILSDNVGSILQNIQTKFDQQINQLQIYDSLNQYKSTSSPFNQSKNKINGKLLNQIWNKQNQFQQSFDYNQISKYVNKLTTELMIKTNKYFQSIKLDIILDLKNTQKLNKLNSQVQTQLVIQQRQQKCQVYWDTNKKSSFLKINQLMIQWNKNLNDKRDNEINLLFEGGKQLTQTSIALISPSLKSVKQQITNWKFKINKLKNKIGFGICQQKILKDKHFQLTHQKNSSQIIDNSCYMIFSQCKNNLNLFGQLNTRQTQSTSLFGGNNNKPIFFAPNNSGSSFGGNFNQNNTSGSSLFGQKSKQISMGGLFGLNNQNSSGMFGSNSQNSSGMFGSNSQSSSGMFGSNNQSSGMFGSNKQSNSGLFAQKMNEYKISQDMVFRQGDMIQMQYNRKENVLKYINLTNKTMKILKNLRVGNDIKLSSLHICVGLGDSGDCVQLMSPLQLYVITKLNPYNN